MATLSSEHEHVTVRQMLPIVGASTLGTAIEWYDFFLYGTVSALVFPALFFPKNDYIAGLLLSFTTNYFGFIARPIGGAFFGHLGDRIGRKSTLVITLLLMGIATVLVGLMPGYAQIGVLAPILVTVLRFFQGFGVGGEWGGSVLLSLEYGHKKDRGFWASWPQVGVPIGLALSSLAVAFFQFFLGGKVFLDWGWRIPFLLSAILIIIGLYVRLRILETPLFAKVQEENAHAKAPVLDAFRYSWKEIVLTALARFGEQSPFYVFTVFVLAYAGKTLGVDNSVLLTGITIAAVIALATMPTFSRWSDRIGRRNWFLTGLVIMAAFAFPYFMLLNTKNSMLVILSIVLSLSLCHAWLYGPEAAMISERFRTKVRYSGASLGYQLASIAGGASPIIAVYLFGQFKSYVPIAIYLIAMTVISFLATLGLREFAKTDISTDDAYETASGD